VVFSGKRMDIEGSGGMSRGTKVIGSGVRVRHGGSTGLRSMDETLDVWKDLKRVRPV